MFSEVRKAFLHRAQNTSPWTVNNVCEIQGGSCYTDVVTRESCRDL